MESFVDYCNGNSNIMLAIFVLLKLDSCLGENDNSNDSIYKNMPPMETIACILIKWYQGYLLLRLFSN